MNQYTASAAETTTGLAKENKLATIVGTKTPGPVLRGTGSKMGRDFMLRIPVVTFYTWRGSVLEGKSVEPDHAAQFAREGVREGLDSQLMASLEAVRWHL